MFADYFAVAVTISACNAVACRLARRDRLRGIAYSLAGDKADFLRVGLRQSGGCACEPTSRRRACHSASGNRVRLNCSCVRQRENTFDLWTCLSGGFNSQRFIRVGRSRPARSAKVATWSGANLRAQSEAGQTSSDVAETARNGRAARQDTPRRTAATTSRSKRSSWLTT